MTEGQFGSGGRILSLYQASAAATDRCICNCQPFHSANASNAASGSSSAYNLLANARRRSRDALVGAGLEAFEAYRHRDTQQIGAQGLKLLVTQSLKIVATHTFGSREYRLDAELVLIIGPYSPEVGWCTKPRLALLPRSASIPITFSCAR